MDFVKVKTSQGSLKTNKGTELGPDLILKGISATEALIAEDNLEETNENIQKTRGDLFVGGDHSITYPLFRAFAEKNKNKKVGLVVFDAHPDCVNEFSPPTHEDFIRNLVEEKTLKSTNLLLIGLRNIDPIEEEFLKDKKIKTILMKDIKNLENTTKIIESFIAPLDRIYLSIDIDVLDAKYAPGTGYPEEKGMKVEDLLFLLKKIRDTKKVGRIDLVEVNPLKDKKNITVENARKILDAFR